MRSRRNPWNPASGVLVLSEPEADRISKEGPRRGPGARAGGGAGAPIRSRGPSAAMSVAMSALMTRLQRNDAQGEDPLHCRECRAVAASCRCYQASFFFSSIMRWMIGVRISSIAKPILPPFTTMLVGLDMNESWIISRR